MNVLRANQIKSKPARYSGWTRGGMALFSVIIMISMLLALPGVRPAYAFPAPVQIYYVTLPEGDALTVLNSISTDADPPIYTYFSIAVGANGAYVYYDQWENGYDSDIANPTNIYSAGNPGGTQIWGNSTAADGCAPNIRGVAVTCTDANDVLKAGDVIIPYNAIGLVGGYNVLDRFNTIAYNNDNGTNNWSGNWVETGDDGAAGTGDILIINNQLRFSETEGGSSNTGDRIDRGVSLPTGDECATLSFTLGYNAVELDGSDRFRVQISDDGGANYTTLATFGDNNNVPAASQSFNISTYAAANNRVRFISRDDLETGEYWTVDDVKVAWGCSRDTSTILFDGKDKVGASKSISMARATWASGSGTLNAFGHEMYATAEWGAAYEAPVGCDTANAGQMFEYSGLSIMASQNYTTVQIDANADGTYETTMTLNEGGTYLEGYHDWPTGCDYLRQGARVQSTDSAKPIQVLLVTGDIGSGYASRDMNLLPTSAYGSSYWSPVGVDTTSSGPTRIYLYNPSTNGKDIYVRCERYTSGLSTNTSLGARKTTYVDLVTGEGARCYATDINGNATTDQIFSIGTVDEDNTAWDWSFTLYPDNFLTTEALVGLGLGKDPTNTTSNENGSPLWVTAACTTGGTYVYVDWNNDSTPDPVDTNGDGTAEAGSQNGILINRLQSVRLFNPTVDTAPYDQSGARVWSRTTAWAGPPNPLPTTPGCNLALMWGADPQRATGGSPGLDVGTSIPPLRQVEGTKALELKTDVDGDGQLSPGDIATYNITVNNTGPIQVANVYVYDVVPSNTSYNTGTTEKDVGSGWASIPDDGSGTPFPLDVLPNGILIGGPLNPGANFYVRFDVTLNALPLGVYDEITNCDVANAEGLRVQSCTTNFVASRDWGDLPDTYGTSASQNGSRHSQGSIWLGSKFDREMQGNPTLFANSDDTTGLFDDEDGLVLVQYDQLAQSLTFNATCTSSSGGPTTGWLVVWFDWNENNTFETSEATIDQQISCSTTGTMTSITKSFVGFEPDELYYRARLFETQPTVYASAWLGPAENGEVEDYYYDIPTAISASSPVATAIDQAIQVDWQTFGEQEIVGFKLYRSTDPSGTDRIKVYETQANHNPTPSDNYGYTDNDVVFGVTYTYWLEVLMKDGSTVIMDPATASIGFKLFLPTIRR